MSPRDLDKLLPPQPTMAGEIQASTQYAAKSSDSQSGMISLANRIRVVAQHPDGGVIYEEVVGSGDTDRPLERMSVQELLDQYRLLPEQVTQSKVKERLRQIEGLGTDHERRDSATNRLLADTLRTIAVYSLSDQEAAGLAGTVIDGVEELESTV